MFQTILLVLVALPIVISSPAEVGSSFAGSTSTAVFPPPGVTVTAGDPNFPDGNMVGFFGPTPSTFRVLQNLSLAI